jgi:DNA replication protein DnaC
LEEATKSSGKLSHSAFLERLLAVEVSAVEERRRASLARFASLPSPFTLADFDFSAQPKLDPKLIRELGTLRFVEDATNVLFIGPPGVGKTMLAVGLGHAAVAAGMRVHYTTAAEPVARCHRAALEGRWATTMRFYAGPRILILDLCRARNYADSRCRPQVGACRRWALRSPRHVSGRHSYRFSRKARRRSGGR